MFHRASWRPVWTGSDTFLLQQFFSLEWLKQFAFASIKFSLIVVKKKRTNYRKTKTLCHPLRNKTKSFTCTRDRSFRLSSNCLRPCDWPELLPFGFGFTTLNPVLNECAWVRTVIYAVIYPHDRSTSTLATILDEWRVTQQSHSKEPPVDRLMRHAWKARFTRMS